MIRILLLMMLTNFAPAKDLGTFGHTFDIAEKDLLEVIETKLQNVDLTAYHEKLRKQVLEPNRVPNITKVQANASRKFDPTVMLEEDIIDENGKVIYVKGFAVNPLNYQAFDGHLLFIDASDDVQHQFAKDYVNTHKNTTVILVGGKSEDFQYFDQWSAYSTRFGIKSVPSVIFQTPDEKVLTIEEVKL